jgi:hypothetical protein
MGNGNLGGIEMMLDGNIVLILLINIIIHRKMSGKKLMESGISLIQGDMFCKMARGSKDKPL